MLKKPTQNKGMMKMPKSIASKQSMPTTHASNGAKSSLDRMKALKKKQQQQKKKNIGTHLSKTGSASVTLPVKAKPQVAVQTADAVAQSVEAHAFVPVPVAVIDLVPWTFKRPDKVTIKRESWNAHVKRIQANACKEAEQENEELHKQLQQVLNERDELAVKYREMSDFVNKFTRSFNATYGG